MKISTHIIQFKTDGHTHMYDITGRVSDSLDETELTEGQVCVFGIGSTTGVSTVEFEPGLTTQDVKNMMEEFAPYEKAYAHNATWGDDNGAAHLRSFLVGTSLNIPFVDGRLILGTWQQVVFVDFDTRPRHRKVVVQVMGV